MGSHKDTKARRGHCLPKAISHIFSCGLLRGSIRKGLRPLHNIFVSLCEPLLS